MIRSRVLIAIDGSTPLVARVTRATVRDGSSSLALTRRGTGLLSRALANSVLVAAITAISMVAGPSAIVNKQLAQHGRQTFANPADMASAIFEDSSRVQTAMQVITALVLLGAMMATVSGVWQVIRGDRGGLEMAAGGVFGLIGLMAAMTVVM